MARLEQLISRVKQAAFSAVKSYDRAITQQMYIATGKALDCGDCPMAQDAIKNGLLSPLAPVGTTIRCNYDPQSTVIGGKTCDREFFVKEHLDLTPYLDPIPPQDPLNPASVSRPYGPIARIGSNQGKSACIYHWTKK